MLGSHRKSLQTIRLTTYTLVPCILFVTLYYIQNVKIEIRRVVSVYEGLHPPLGVDTIDENKGGVVLHSFTTATGCGEYLCYDLVYQNGHWIVLRPTWRYGSD